MLAIDSKYLIDTFFSLVSLPSPVGYHVEVNPRLAEITSALGERLSLDRRGNAYIRIAGEGTAGGIFIQQHINLAFSLF